MSTFLSKLFKPKWQSKSPEVRKEAIRQLDLHSDEDQKILQDLAQSDSNAQVRAEAIARISSSQTLIQLHQHAAPETKGVIEKRLYDLAQSQSLTLFDLIVDNQLLTDMIIKSVSPDAFINGLAHIEDPDALLRIAQQGKTSRIRQAAAELIETEQELSTLIQSAKGKDKSVYQIAKNKLARIKAHLKVQQERIEALEKLIAGIEEHARTESTQMYDAKLENLEMRWKELSAGADAKQQLRFDTAREQCILKRDSILAEQRQREEQQRLEQVGGDEQEATLLTLSQTLERFRQMPASIQETSALDALIKTQENRWLEATRHTSVDKNQIKHYQMLMSELRHYHKALKATAEHQEQLESELLKHKKIQPGQTKIDAETKTLNEHSRALRTLLDTIDWPRNYARPDVIERASEALGETAELKHDLAANAREIQQKIDDGIARLDQALEEKQLKASNKHLKTVQKLISQLSGKHSERIQNQLTLRLKQLNDLRDWQGFAAHPRQELLCEAMEKLAQQHMDPVEKADKIKAMQKEWKTLGGARDQDLWLRFKQAADQAYEPCKAFFEEQSRLKATNIERRETLIQQLETFIQSNDWENTDWKAAERINREARAEWKAAYPVDFKQNKPLQSRFNALLSELEKHLDAERKQNLALKQEVVDKAQTLIENENLEEAMNTAKTLQKQWQSIGITDHRKDRALWKQFRSACDAIFARRDQIKADRQQEIAGAISSAEETLATLKTAFEQAGTEDLSKLKALLGDCRKAIKQLPALPKKAHDDINIRFESLINDLKSSIQHLENRTERSRWSELARKADICRQQFGQKSPPDALSQFDDEFSSRGTLTAEQDAAMKSLWISIKADQVHPGALLDEETARDFCIRCEIAAGLDSPEQDRERRMQLQVSRLSEGMTMANEHVSRESQLAELLNAWYARVGLASGDYAPYESRIRSAVDHLFGKDESA